jgi:hypothetical protein
VDGQVERGDRHVGPQAEAGEFLQQHVALGALAVDQQAAAIGQDEEIGEVFALRRQQRGPDGVFACDERNVVGNQSVKERNAIGARHGKHRAFRQKSKWCHVANVVQPP